MSPQAREIVVGDDPAAWERLGFAVGAGGWFAVGGVWLRAAGSGSMRVAAAGLRAERPDGLALVREAADRPAAAATSPRAADHPPAPEHPNGAVAVDHVVAFTDDLDRTVRSLQRAGLDLRRVREPPEAPARQAFLRLGEPVLELVETGRGPAAFWGLVVVVADLSALGPLVGAPHDAVQPGRRIATVRREANLSVALAFMTPQPQPRPAG